MGWFKPKKTDPISERERALSDEIAALESQIKRLHSKPESGAPAPRLRSTALPHSGPAASQPAAPASREPIFEDVNHQRLAKGEPMLTREHYNDLGIRKYDLAAMVRRVQNHFRGPSAANPKLVNYLAAGSIQGLRPMRYEKRVHRNRLIFIVIILLALLVGTFVMLRNHF